MIKFKAVSFVLASFLSTSVLADTTYYTCRKEFKNGDILNVKMTEKAAKKYVLDVTFFNNKTKVSARQLIPVKPQTDIPDEPAALSAIWQDKASGNRISIYYNYEDAQQAPIVSAQLSILNSIPNGQLINNLEGSSLYKLSSDDEYYSTIVSSFEFNIPCPSNH